LIHNKILPFGSFHAFACFPFIFYKGDRPTGALYNHELIHFTQQKELFLIGFYILYVLFWMQYGYLNNPLEREAIDNQFNEEYLKNRKKFEWKRYILVNN
jgi:hypothetical protein